MADWSAAEYLRFADERTRPVRDLLAAVPNPAARRVADLGCGPGNSTALLAARFADAEVLGVDNSPDMLDAARAALPACRFALRTVQAWAAEAGETFDVILSNAALHWVPDHAALLPRLMGRLAPGGRLAVQMPDNLGEPAHVLMREVAADPRWAVPLAEVGGLRTKLADAGWYYATLRPVAARVDVWRTTYHHPLAGAAAVVAWFRGSGLRPYLDAMAADQQADFLTRYEAAVAGAYPALADGTVLLPFPRLFMVATR
jgi:trans-aconitate 2-methyltransferase